jgi:hypothetical protein
MTTLVQIVFVTVCDDLRLRRAQHWLELLIRTALVYDRRVLESMISALIERCYKIGITHGCPVFDA